MRGISRGWPQRARDGLEVDLTWRDGALQAATIRSRLGRPLQVRLGERSATFPTRAGEALQLRQGLHGLGRRSRQFHDRDQASHAAS
jgi:hypothetical protein